METYFVVADDIQTMADGKLLAVGLYPDRTLVLSPLPGMEPGRDVVLSKLCCLLNIQKLPAGEYDLRPTITLPNGKPAPEVRAMSVKLEREGGANFLCQFAPFPVPEAGRYLFTIDIAGRKVTHDFTIKLAPGLSLPSAIGDPKGSRAGLVKKTPAKKASRPGATKRAGVPARPASKARGDR